ncbi:MAG TPA: hypothetical protein VKN18_09390 [Blastocatellia bacterium]|nr:hypothetical protein [Blastocatellia bacterium]
MKRVAGNGEITYKCAQAYDALGDREASLRTLDRSVDQGFFCVPYFASDPLFKTVRSEPGFARIVEKAQQRQEAFKRKLEASR